MADMPGDFWSGWIITLTVVSLAAMIWLVFSIYFSPSPHPKKEEEHPPVWDEDMEEGDAPAPMWWFWLIFGSMIFSVLYLILYPGLGSFSGVLNWSQDARVRNAYENYDDRFGEIRSRIAGSPLSDLQDDRELMEIAQQIFRRECAACHGEDGRGQAQLFPNLMDVAWQWGDTPEQIEQSIRNGRQANMPAWAGTLDEETIGQLADYSIALGTDAAEGHAGTEAYRQYCSGCHGADGGGNPAIGAPSLADDSWLYGGDRATLIYTLANGRNGVMPAYGDRLDETQLRLLLAWLAR